MYFTNLIKKLNIKYIIMCKIMIIQIMNIILDNDKSLYSLCNFNKLEYVIFKRNIDYSLCKMLHKVFPNKTFAYELSNNDEPEPFYPSLTKFTIDQYLFDERLSHNDIDFYIQSIHKSKFKIISNHNDGTEIYDIVISKSIKLIHLFYDYLTNITRPTPTSKKNYIFIWSTFYGSYIEDVKSLDRSINDLIGLEYYFELIKNDIIRQEKHQQLLIKLGATSGLNYMLYGPPGTGKSSFVKAISTIFEIPIYVAKITQASNETQLTKMLIPMKEEKSISSLKLVLLEDFDRYLENNKENKAIMSSILNALDGVFSAIHVIRFFSANDPKIINKNGALASRMNRTLFFDLPNIDQIKEQINRVYGNTCEYELLNQLAIKFANNKLSMRYITNYLCRFLDENDKLSMAYNHFSAYIDELINFNKYKKEINDIQIKDADLEIKYLDINI